MPLRIRLGFLLLVILFSVFAPVDLLAKSPIVEENVVAKQPTIIIQYVVENIVLEAKAAASLGISVDEEPTQRPIDPLHQQVIDLAGKRQLTEKEIDEILITASLIGKEGGNYYSKSNVSAVIKNRLAQNMRLQLDPTIQYSLWQGEKWGKIKSSDRKIDSPYNTYKYSGLPPTMIAVPSAESIKAALNPAKTDALYFIHDNAGQIHLAKTFAQHQENIQKYLKPKSS